AGRMPRRRSTHPRSPSRGTETGRVARGRSFRMKVVALVVALCLSIVTTSARGEEPGGAARSKPEVQTRESQAAMTPSEAPARLTAGNGRFVANAPKRRDWSAKVAATAAGQFPFAAVLACMDSRAPIEILFDQGLGDVFGVRVAGNVVNEDEL